MAKILNETNFKLIINSSLLRKSEKGLIAAPIFFDLDNIQFPEENWFDFPIVIVDWWLNAYSDLLNGSEKTVELSFMDGPMIIVVTTIDSNLIKISCINQRKSYDLIEVEGIVDKTFFSLTLKKTAQYLVDYCLEKNWDSIDIQNLNRDLNSFKLTIDKMK